MPNAPAPPATRYVVSRLNWRRAGTGWVRVPGDTRLASFDSPEAADADAARREADARKTVNPFRCGRSLFYLTTLPGPVLRDWLRDAGIDPPGPPADAPAAWATWWTRDGKALSDRQRAAVWQALDKVRFFRAEERPARPVAFAVVELNWNYNDEFYTAAPEGGTVLTLYRSRESADRERAARDAAARSAWEREFTRAGLDPDADDDDDDSFKQLDVYPRVEAAADPFAKRKQRDWEAEGGRLRAPAEVAFHEVIEVELEGGG